MLRLNTFLGAGMNSNVRDLAIRAGAQVEKTESGQENLTLAGNDIIMNFVSKILETNLNLTASAVGAYKIDNLVVVADYLKKYYGLK